MYSAAPAVYFDDSDDEDYVSFEFGTKQYLSL